MASPHAGRASSKVRAAAIRNGWRSGLEEALGRQLDAFGVSAEYETLTIPFLQPQKPRTYKPDFILPNGIILESKGIFQTADRQKHLLIQQQYPDLDIRFVFSNANQRITKVSKTTYAAWSESKGFLWAHRIIPLEWLEEEPNEASLAAIREIRRRSKK